MVLAKVLGLVTEMEELKSAILEESFAFSPMTTFASFPRATIIGAVPEIDLLVNSPRSVISPP